MAEPFKFTSTTDAGKADDLRHALVEQMQVIAVSDDEKPRRVVIAHGASFAPMLAGMLEAQAAAAIVATDLLAEVEAFGAAAFGSRRPRRFTYEDPVPPTPKKQKAKSNRTRQREARRTNRRGRK